MCDINEAFSSNKLSQQDIRYSIPRDKLHIYNKYKELIDKRFDISNALNELETMENTKTSNFEIAKQNLKTKFNEDFNDLVEIKISDEFGLKSELFMRLDGSNYFKSNKTGQYYSYSFINSINFIKISINNITGKITYYD